MNDIDRYLKKISKRVSQGNIYKDIFITEAKRNLPEAKLKVKEIPIEYSVVLTQDCDLEQDYNARNDLSEPSETTHDKYLSYILLSPLHLEDAFRKGEHLLNFGRKVKRKNSDEARSIKKNLNFRYHFLKKDTKIPISELVVDFKHFFTIERNFFYETYHSKSHFVCSINYLFREDLNQRFSNFLSRIPLPEIPID